MAMLTHTWIDQYDNEAPEQGLELRKMIAGAVQFDCGDQENIPIGKGSEIWDARPPFPVTILQFEQPDNDLVSHWLVIFKEYDEKTNWVMCAQRGRKDKRWRTLFPLSVTRLPNKEWRFEEIIQTDKPRNPFKTRKDSIESSFALAKNVFYVIGCSNVEMVKNQPPEALNKKRARTGKLPILEYKTLALKVTAPSQQQNQLGGTHASPRLHLRRGHVRRLQSGRRVWVQPCVVGSPHGAIVKDYRITA